MGFLSPLPPRSCNTVSGLTPLGSLLGGQQSQMQQPMPLGIFGPSPTWCDFFTPSNKPHEVYVSFYDRLRNEIDDWIKLNN
jgi:hypothetical protein